MRSRACTTSTGSRRAATVLLVVLAGCLALTAQAHAATTFAVAVRPATPGTAAAPAPVAVAFRASLAPDGPSGPPPALHSLGVALPDGFVTALGGTTSCIRADLEARGSSACPASSKLGSGSAQFTVLFSGLRIPAETEEVGLYRGVGDELLLYLRVARPAPLSIVLPGTLTSRPAPLGPLVVFDLSETAQPGGGTSVVVTDAALDVARGLAAGACPTGSWRFTARLAYAGGQTEDRTADARCAPDTTPPVLRASARNGTPALGARFAVRLSEPAIVRVALQRRAGSRWVAVRRATFRAVAGSSRLRIRRVGGRSLRPGRYRARIQATDAAGLTSRRLTVTFTLRRPR